MKLLLTSNGVTSPEIKLAFENFVNGRANLKVAIIPTASEPIEWVLEKEGNVAPYDSIAKLTKARDIDLEKWPLYLYYKNMGFDVICVDLKENPKSIKEKLYNVDIIDVPGGDANWLLDWGKKSELDTYLKDLLNNGVVYIGTSAGSCLLLPDIGLTWWEPEWKLDHIGFGVVDFVVVPHQKESDKQSNVENLTKRRDHLHSLINFPWRIYLLQDGQAIKVDGDKVEHIGDGIKRYI